MSTDADIITRWGYLPSRDADAPTKAMALFSILGVSEQRNITPPPNPRMLEMTKFVITDKFEATYNGKRRSIPSIHVIDAFKCLHRFYKTKVITEELTLGFNTQIFEFYLINWLLRDFKTEHPEAFDDGGHLMDEFAQDFPDTYFDWMEPLAKALEIMINLKLQRNELLYERMRIWLPELRSIQNVELYDYFMIKSGRDVHIERRNDAMNHVSGQTIMQGNLTVQQILGPYFDEFSLSQRLSLRGFAREFDPDTQRATPRAPLPAQAMKSIREFLGVARWRAR